MHVYPPAARTMMLATWALALAVSTFSVRLEGLPLTQAWTFLVMLALASLTLLYPIRSAREQTVYSLCNVFVFAASILMPHSLTALLCVLMWLPVLPARAAQWKGWELIAPPLTNASQMILITFGTTWLLRAVDARGLDTPGAVAWVCLAAVLYVICQIGYVNLLTMLYRKVAWQSLDGAHLDALVTESVIIFLGTIVAALWLHHPPLLLFAAIPIALSYRILRGVQLVKMAELDPKTHLYSNRYFEEQLRAELKRSVALRLPVALIFADLDYLREINNTHGHQAGDATILAIARIMEEHAAKGGIAARFGGEEFVLLLPGTDIHEAAYLAERLREAVEQARIPTGDGQVLTCTMSLGVAAYPHDGQTPEALVKAADDAMYLAKASGRNRVCVAGDRVQTQPAAGAVTEVTIQDEPEPPEAPGGQTHEQPASAPVSTAQTSAPTTARFIPLMNALCLLAALAIVAFTVESLSLQSTPWLTIGLFVAMGVFAERLKVRVAAPDGTEASLSITAAVALAAATHVGAAAAVLVNILAVLSHAVELRHRDLYRIMLNLSIAVIAAWAGSLPSHLLRLAGLWEAPTIGFLAIVVAAGLYYITNMGLLALHFSLTRNQSPVAIWRQGMAYLTPHFLSLALVGAFLGRVYPIIGPVGTLTLVALLLLVRRTFQLQIQHMDAGLKAVQETRDLLARANRLEKQSLRELTEAVSAIIDARDASVYGHSRQVARYAVALAEELGITNPTEIDEIRTAALLHDLGKVGVPEVILHKPERLTQAEYEVIKQHPGIGERILHEVESLRKVAIYVGAHHEYWDGRGYPLGRRGEAIPLPARILAVADTLDSILTDRPYSRARSLDSALSELRRCSGTQFDPSVVEAAHRLAERWPRHYFQNPLLTKGSSPLPIREVAAAMQRDG